LKAQNVYSNAVACHEISYLSPVTLEVGSAIHDGVPPGLFTMWDLDDNEIYDDKICFGADGEGDESRSKCTEADGDDIDAILAAIYLGDDRDSDLELVSVRFSSGQICELTCQLDG
jgi:hypothetical protein